VPHILPWNDDLQSDASLHSSRDLWSDDVILADSEDDSLDLSLSSEEDCLPCSSSFDPDATPNNHSQSSASTSTSIATPTDIDISDQILQDSSVPHIFLDYTNTYKTMEGSASAKMCDESDEFILDLDDMDCDPFSHTNHDGGPKLPRGCLEYQILGMQSCTLHPQNQNEEASAHSLERLIDLQATSGADFSPFSGNVDLDLNMFSSSDSDFGEKLILNDFECLLDMCSGEDETF
jgi:hypothetical protein